MTIFTSTRFSKDPSGLPEQVPASSIVEVADKVVLEGGRYDSSPFVREVACAVRPQPRMVTTAKPLEIGGPNGRASWISGHGPQFAGQ